MNGTETEPHAKTDNLGREAPLGGASATLAKPPGLRSLRLNDPGAAEKSGGMAHGLGWFSVGLGLTQLLAPRTLGKFIGVGDSDRTRRTMRLCGARELTAGLGLLSRPDSAGWLWSRVAGDVMDIGLLLGALGSRRSKPSRLSLAIGAVAGVTVLDVLASRRNSPIAARRGRASVKEPVRITSIVTVGHSPEEAYGVWRNFQNLPRFMSTLQSVEVLDSRQSHWKATAPGGQSVEWDATVTDDRPHELIAWTAKGTGAASGLVHAGEVRFQRAPGGRGTEIRLIMWAKPPGGPAVGLIAKALRKIPERQVENDLRRFKQLIEIGEVVLSDASIHRGPHPARPSKAEPTQAEVEAEVTKAEPATKAEGTTNGASSITDPHLPGPASNTTTI